MGIGGQWRLKLGYFPPFRPSHANLAFFVCAKAKTPLASFRSQLGERKKSNSMEKGSEEKKMLPLSVLFVWACREASGSEVQASQRKCRGEKYPTNGFIYRETFFLSGGEESSNGLSTRNVKNSRSFVCLQTVMRHEWTLWPSKTTVRTINVRRIIKCNPIKRAQPACLLIQPRDE